MLLLGATKDWISSYTSSEKEKGKGRKGERGREDEEIGMRDRRWTHFSIPPHPAPCSQMSRRTDDHTLAEEREGGSG